MPSMFENVQLCAVISMYGASGTKHTKKIVFLSLRTKFCQVWLLTFSNNNIPGSLFEPVSI